MLIEIGIFVVAFCFGAGVRAALGHDPVSRYWRDWCQGYAAARREGWGRRGSWVAGHEWANFRGEDT